MSFSDFLFGYPHIAYLGLVILVILWLFRQLAHFRKKTLAQFASPELLSQMMTPPSDVHRKLRVLLFCLAWLSAVAALMDPKGHGRYPDGQNSGQEFNSSQAQDATFTLRRKAHDVMFLIDTSASTGTTDTRIGKTRLDYAKEIVDQMTSDLKGEAASLYAFTSEVIPFVPSTLDYLYLRLMLDRVTINAGNTAGTDLAKTLEFMQDRWQAENPSKLKTLILLSDGGDTTWESLRGQARLDREEAILQPLKDAEKENLRVIVIGLGTKEGATIPHVNDRGQPVRSVLEEQLLKKISEQGRGSYLVANEDTPTNLALQVTQLLAEDRSIYEEKTVTRKTLIGSQTAQMIFDLYFQYPLGLAIFFLIWAMTIPENKRNQVNHA